MKPDSRTAMTQLIEEVRQVIPFDLPESVICSGNCIGCSKKLLEFLDQELIDWQERLDEGVTPKLGELSKLARTAKKIHKVMVKNGLIDQCQ